MWESSASKPPVSRSCVKLFAKAKQATTSDLKTVVDSNEVRLGVAQLPNQAHKCNFSVKYDGRKVKNANFYYR